MKKLRVLLVDDEIMIREGFKRSLTGRPTTARWRTRPETAWRRWRESPPAPVRRERIGMLKRGSRHEYFLKAD